MRRWLDVDGLRTYYLDAGRGRRTVVLLHSGEFGASAELSWERAIGPLADHYRVIAPDLLGYGRTDKVFDFQKGHRRRVQHVQRFVEVLGVDGAAFIGNSMGGTLLARVAASDRPVWPIEAIVLASGGGYIPDNEWRRRLLDYDCTSESMRAIVSALFYDQRFAEDADYVSRRQHSALLPGAWECAAAARFKSPAVSARSEFGGADTTPYELIDVPTMIIAGGADLLREPGYANELQQRIVGSELRVYENCGHMPNIEMSERFNADVLGFLLQCYPPE